MQRRDIDAFGIEQTAEGPLYCRVLVTATNECQRNLNYMVPIDDFTSDVKKVLIHCTREQAQGEYDCDLIVLLVAWATGATGELYQTTFLFPCTMPCVVY